MGKLISIYNNPQRGYVFCASTTILNKKLHTNVRPIIMLPLEEISEENIGKCIRETIELAKNARPVDSEKEELYEFWKDAGYKTFGRFSKEHICIELEEKEDKYFYQYYVYYKQGCYTGTCHWYERDYVNNNISNKELGHHIIEQMNSVKGQSFKKWTKYIWDGSTWINTKKKK